MNALIGYYVHHHGDGHRQRALAIAKAVTCRFTLLGTGLSGKTEGTSCLDLAADHDSNVDCDPMIGIGESLHYAPQDHDGIRQRVAMMSDWILREKPSLIVVDVSVEVAMLVRLTSTPMVYVRLSGNRNDPPHRDVFRAAAGIIAPFHRDLEGPGIAPWLSDKTTYIPGLSRLNRGPVAGGDIILVVGGKGGRPIDGSDLAAAATATPDKIWRAIGPVTRPDTLPPNLAIAGWVETADEEIAKAGIVIGHAGDGLVNAVIAARRPFICLPQNRPFGEQTIKAARLQALGVSIILETWPHASAWPDLLRRAQSLDLHAIDRLHDPDGATRAAAFLQSLIL